MSLQPAEWPQPWLWSACTIAPLCGLAPVSMETKLHAGWTAWIELDQSATLCVQHRKSSRQPAPTICRRCFCLSRSKACGEFLYKHATVRSVLGGVCCWSTTIRTSLSGSCEATTRVHVALTTDACVGKAYLCVVCVRASGKMGVRCGSLWRLLGVQRVVCEDAATGVFSLSCS